MKLKTTQIYANDLKAPRIPEGFVLLQDSREQRPLYDETNTPRGLEVVTTGLAGGDYSIRGFEDRFCVERKQLSDFYSYVGKERHKTVRKMGDFRDMISRGGWVGLVIEATEADILCGYIMSRVPPEAARASLVSFNVRYGVQTFYSRSRKDIRRWVLDRAIKWYKIQREVAP
jgi:DNA excision repair protein ERCC-4